MAFTRSLSLSNNPKILDYLILKVSKSRYVKNKKILSSMMERLNNEINIFADTITSTQRAGHIIQINRKQFCDLRHVQIEKTIVQSLSLKETFSLSFFMKANHC